jgi:hypothetical protein
MISNSNLNSDYLVKNEQITKTSQEKLFDVKICHFDLTVLALKLTKDKFQQSF